VTNKAYKLAASLTLTLAISACADSTPLEVTRGLLGYIPPPETTTVSQELRLEYDRCMKIDKSQNCAQKAYDVVRVVKGLEPKPIPKGYVIILKGEGEHLNSKEEKSAKEEKTPEDE
jgi:hypothetical protein